MKLYFTLVTSEDATTLFEWRNSPITRANSHQKEELNWEDHLQWFSQSLKNEGRKIHRVCADLNGVRTFVATIREDRLETSPEAWNLSWMVDPSLHGQGIGKQLLSQFVQNYPGVYFAEIKNENIPSIKMALNAGFVEWESASDYKRYRYSAH